MAIIIWSWSACCGSVNWDVIMLFIPFISVLLFASQVVGNTLPHTSTRFDYTSCGETNNSLSGRECGTDGSIGLVYTGSIFTLHGSPSPPNSTAQIRVQFDNDVLGDSHTVRPFASVLFEQTEIPDDNIKEHRILLKVLEGNITFTRAEYFSYENERRNRKTGLSAGAIAGIVVGCVVGVALLIVGVLVLRKKRNASKGSTILPTNRSMTQTSVDGTTAGPKQSTESSVARMDSTAPLPLHETVPSSRRT